MGLPTTTTPLASGQLDLLRRGSAESRFPTIATQRDGWLKSEMVKKDGREGEEEYVYTYIYIYSPTLVREYNV